MPWSRCRRCFLLAAGRAHRLGFLGAAQIDKFANLNSTVIGDYNKPKVRLPGAGGAPEIAAHCGEVLITLRQSNRAFVKKLDFLTSAGHFEGGVAARSTNCGARADGGDHGSRHTHSRSGSKELTLTSVHPGVTVDQVRAATGWELKVADTVTTTERQRSGS